MYAKGVAHPDLKFEAITQNGIEQIFALCHWRSEKETTKEYTSAMIGVFTDQVVRRQQETEPYVNGVKNLFKALWATLQS
jgi:hypothetical protein